MNEDEAQVDDPRQMLALIDATRRETIHRLTGRYVGLFVLWAVAWAVGFGALWFTRDVGGVELLAPAVGWVIFAASLVIAIVWSAVVGIRAGSDGIRGRSQLQGALYGCSWTIVMLAAWGLLSGLQQHGLSNELAQLLYPGLYVFLVGALYLSGGALFRAVPMYILGGALIVIVVIATFIGAPNHYLVYAIAPPLAMLSVAALMHWGPIEAISAEES